LQIENFKHQWLEMGNSARTITLIAAARLDILSSQCLPPAMNHYVHAGISDAKQWCAAAKKPIFIYFSLKNVVLVHCLDILSSSFESAGRQQTATCATQLI
jgi:hypothetical protein